MDLKKLIAQRARELELANTGLADVNADFEAKLAALKASHKAKLAIATENVEGCKAALARLQKLDKGPEAPKAANGAGAAAQA